MIPYGRQDIDNSDIQAVIDVLKSDYLTTGPKIREFEDAIASYIGVKYAVAVSNGTAALHLACLAAQLESNAELITSAMTFAASANCALYCGAKPIFCDITASGLLDSDQLEPLINPKSKILIPVHYSGRPCDMKRIHDIAQKHNIIIIEDS